MYPRTKLLLAALQAEKDTSFCVEVNPGFVSFAPLEKDWETLIRYGLVDKKGNLTKGGQYYCPLPDASHLGTKGLSKGFVSMAQELNQRIANEGYNPSNEEIEVISNLINTINFKLNPIDEVTQELPAPPETIDYTIDNTVSYGTEAEEIKEVEEVVKKTRKKKV